MTYCHFKNKNLSLLRIFLMNQVTSKGGQILLGLINGIVVLCYIKWLTRHGLTIIFIFWEFVIFRLYVFRREEASSYVLMLAGRSVFNFFLKKIHEDSFLRWWSLLKPLSSHWHHQMSPEKLRNSSSFHFNRSRHSVDQSLDVNGQLRVHLFL